MAESSQMTGKIEFLQFHQPYLRDGAYTVQFKHSISHEKITEQNVFQTNSKSFRVIGERFALNPTDVQIVFPPENSSGDHAMVIPHVILNRSTLPWERFAAEGDEATPWLALLVFNEEEMSEVKSSVVTFGQLSVGSDSTPLHFPALTPEQEGDSDRISVIDVPWKVLKQLLPSREEMSLQAHVRQARDEQGNLEGPERAVVVANRLPESGKITTVHLVSLESCLEKDTGSFYAANALPTDLIRLVTLKSWQFSCEQLKGSFKEIVGSLNLDPPYFRLSANAAGAEPILDLGGILVPHTLRDGGRTVSIYHGPLVGYQQTATQSTGPISFPAAAADELLGYVQKYGLFLTGYAAAWELGRLLTLRNSRVANELFQWKRLLAQQSNQVDQVKADPNLPHHQQALFLMQNLQVPDSINNWFESLRTLQGLPFNYLVPDETMLPIESLRFFWVDPFWVGALLDGAFSIGRVTHNDRQADIENSKVLQALWKRPVTGVLIRSAAVSGWPDLLIDGLNAIFSDEQPHPDAILPLLRLERLSAEVIICLFDGEALTIDIHQKPETLHFGLDSPDQTHKDYYKKLRNTTGIEAGLEVSPIPWQGGNAASRIIDMQSFGEMIKNKLASNPSQPAPAFTSAQFALEMIEGVQKVRFSFGSPR
jgi:hypothetical protein